MGLSNYNLKSTQANVSAPTTYTVKAIDDNGCTNTNTIFINQFAKPVLTKTPTANTIIACRLDSTLLRVSGAITYTWLPTIGLNMATGPNVKANVPTGSKNYVATGTDFNGCTATASFFISSRKCDSLEAIYFLDTSVICGNGCVTFLDSSTGNPDAWVWAFTGGNPSTFNGKNPGLVCYNAPGLYNIGLTITTSGIQSSKTLNNVVAVKANPTLTLTSSTDVVCPGDSTYIKVTGASTYVFTPNPSLRLGRADSAIVTPYATTTYYIRGSKFEVNNGSSIGGQPEGSASSGGSVSNKNCITDTFKTIAICSSLTLNDIRLFGNKYINENTLNWTINNLPNTLIYYLQRSDDGLIFNTIYTKANNNINFFNDNYFNTKSYTYYRIYWMDENNHTKYSNTIIIDNLIKNFIAIWPNPITTQINITYNNQQATTLKINIFNNLGKLVYKNQVYANFTSQTQSINTLNFLKGTYYVNISGKRYNKTTKIVK